MTSPPIDTAELRRETEGGPCAATPSAELACRIMDSNVPKNEQEWWARQRILSLLDELEKARAEVAETQRRHSGDLKAMYNINSGLADATERAAFNRGLERALAIAEPWAKSDHIQLKAGEMTAQELRSVKAVVGAILAAIRAEIKS